MAKAIGLAAEEADFECHSQLEAVFSALEAALEVDLEAELVRQHLEAEFVQQLEADFEIDRHSLEADFLEDAFEAELAFEAEHFEVGPHLEAVLVGHLKFYFEQQLEAVFHQVELTCWPRSEAVLELHWKAERLEAG